MTLNELKKSGPVIIAVFVTLFLYTTQVRAAPVTFPSGETVGLSITQFNGLKQHPHLFNVPCRKGEIIPANITEMVSVGMPEEPNSGFLVGHPGVLLSETSGAESNLSDETSADNSLKPVTKENLQLEFVLEGGYRVDGLRFNVSGDNYGRNPNILSELTWTDLQIFQLKLSSTALVKKAVYLRGYADYGWIFSGNNQDSDYAGDNRTFEFSRSNNSTDGDKVLDGSLGVGFNMSFGDGSFRLIPILGYSYHQQNLRITDGHQTIPALGSFPGLNSTFETRWHGPWIGVDLKIETSEWDFFFKKGTFFSTFELHRANYYAEANWNLRADFAHPKSFTQDAIGFGTIFQTGAKLSVTDDWSMTIGYNYSYWTARNGTNLFFFADGTRGTTRLNEIVWKSHVLSLGIAHQF